MPIEIVQVTTANMVIARFEALNNEPGLLSFLQEISDLVLTDQQVDGTISLDIQAQRISIVRRPDASTLIQREFPVSLDELDQFAEVAWLAISNTDTHQDLHTFGFNVEAACTQHSEESTSRFLAEHFFSLGGLAKIGFRDFGSSSWELEFSDDDRRWRLSVRRFENVFEAPNLYLTLNSHHESQPLPDKQTIIKRIRETWNGIPKFIEKLERAS